MLRNVVFTLVCHIAICVLNEVLSLNAQELFHPLRVDRPFQVLNEVLSLNAQEFVNRFVDRADVILSSMKS